MARRKNWSAEQIVAKLWQIEVQIAQGKSLALACKEAEISGQNSHRWRKEYGGVAVERARRLTSLERENARLCRLVADLSLEKQILRDGALRRSDDLRKALPPVLCRATTRESHPRPLVWSDR